MIDFLVQNPLFVILLCLAVGYLFGKVKLGSFPNNATLGTLYAAILMNLLISGAGGSFAGDSVKVMKTFFFALFTFTLGYDAGPVFVSSVRKSGVRSCLKLVGMAVFFCGSALVCGYLLAKAAGLTVGQTMGMMAGALTQSTILNDGSDVIAYAVTYILGTLGMIIFVQKIAPAMIGADIGQAIQRKTTELNKPIKSDRIIPVAAIQSRVYRVEKKSAYIGQTVEKLENAYDEMIQIQRILHAGKELPLSQSAVISCGDILVVTGHVSKISEFDNHGLSEVTDGVYSVVDNVHVDIIVSKEVETDFADKLSEKGILIRQILRKGSPVSLEKLDGFQRRDVLSLTGPAPAIQSLAREIGYVKDIGHTSDVTAILLPIALAIPLGMIRIPGIGLSLGTSCCALLLGMAMGCLYENEPKYGKMAEGVRWFSRSLGLNLFIAATALERSLVPSEIFTVHVLYIMLLGLVLTFVPAFLSVLFGKLVLKLDAVELLGGICGSATSTPALNAVSEDRGSTIFTVGYTPAYVISNILLTIVGTVIAALL